MAQGVPVMLVLGLVGCALALSATAVEAMASAGDGRHGGGGGAHGGVRRVVERGMFCHG